MSALLAGVETGGDLLAETVTTPGRRRVTVVGAAGAGKAAAMRHARHTLEDAGVASILLEATDDDLAAVALLDGLASGLEATGHPLPATDDADRAAWDDRLRGCSLALRSATENGLIVLISGVDRLQRLSEGGGTPGRHAADVLHLLDHDAPRLATSSMAPRRANARTITIDTQDLGDWLADAEAWGTLAPAAVDVASQGVAWRRLPALTVRLCVGLAHLEALPPTPPATPVQAGRSLADELAARRATRPVWAGWQLVAGLRGPFPDLALDALLEDLPDGLRDDPLLHHCLLFWHDGWHLHPILREVVRQPPPTAGGRALPDDLVRQAGRRMVEHFRGHAIRCAVDGNREASAAARAAALDACAMAQDDVLAEGLADEVPDPYDHIGRRAAHEPSRSRTAFGRARLIDGGDATALRGLADAGDRQAVDAADVEQLFRRVIDLEPRDANSYVRLVGVLLATGRPRGALEAFEEAAGTLAGALDEDELAERLFVPIARAAIAAGHLPLASRAAGAARGALAVVEARELDRLVEALVETLEYGEFVAPDRLGTRWWLQPEALADFDVNRYPLSRWLAARVDAVEDDGASLHYADVVVPAGPDGRPERAWTAIGVADLRRLSLDELPDALPGTILEIGVYGDGEQEGSTVVRVVNGDAVTLPQPELPLDRYARHAP